MLLYKGCSNETNLELFWVKRYSPLKIVPMNAEGGIPLMHQPMDSLHKEILKTQIYGSLALAFKDPDITINIQCYYGTLRDLLTAIKRKHPSMLTRGVITFHDNAHLHVARTIHDTLCSICWKVSNHPPYSPDL
jgi:hypothetical protein